MENISYGNRRGLLTWLSTAALLGPALTGFAQAPANSVDDEQVLKIFGTSVQAYLKVRKEAAAAVPALKPTKDAAKLLAHQQALAQSIIQARANAKQGDIFTEEVTPWFRRIISTEFKGPGAPAARKTVRQDEPAQRVRLHVNEIYPENVPLTTMPPTLLKKLPVLPPELVYRITANDLALVDLKACVILDLILNAIP